MKSLKLILTLGFLLALSSNALAQMVLSGTVTEVLNGRTVVIEPQSGIKITLKLHYIEVPEPEQPLHQTVNDHLKAMLLNKEVEFLAQGVSKRDSYGQIFLNGTDVSQQMLRDGAAWYKEGTGGESDKLYTETQAQAKAERRGVWSIDGLKPAWEFRAEKERKRREKFEEEYALKVANSPNRRLTERERRIANERVKIWADTSWYGALIANPKLVSMYEDAPGATEPIVGYTEKGNIGYMATQLTAVDIVTRGGKHKMFGTLAYYDPKNISGVAESLYVLILISQSQTPNFNRVRRLNLRTEKGAIRIYRSKRVVNTVPEGVQEVLLYGITSRQARKLRAAKSVRVGVGKYSTKLSRVFRSRIRTLISRLN